LKRGRIFLTYSWLIAGSPSHSIAITVAGSSGASAVRPVILSDKSFCVNVSGLSPTRRRTDFTFDIGEQQRVPRERVALVRTFAEAREETRLFVRPPYTFRGVDKLITNFHLPRSTLLMLVAALAGYDLTMRAYGEAVDAGYRFYSYGDAMAIV